MSDIESGELEEGQAISEKQQSSQFIIPKMAGKKQLCEVCELALRKYTCPKCGKKTCGIACLNKHKKNGNCSGMADPFTSLDQKHIEEKDVQKDYRFVKEMLANADKVKRTLTGVDSFGQEPKRFKIMRINAKKQYNINLMHAPAIIERHRENISFYFVKTKTFYWVIQILFWRQEGEKQICSRYLSQPLADSSTIHEILPQEYLCLDLLEKGINTKKKQQFSVFLERKENKSNVKVVFQLPHNKTLAQCLTNQNVYEFPTLIAVHNTLKEAYLSKRQLLL